MKKIFLLPLALLALVSCGDDDSKIAPIEQVSEGTVFGTAEHPINIGGSNQQNEVFIDLSEESTTVVSRDSWDLGFYSGSGFKVVTNGAIVMAAKELQTTDITLPQTEDATVAVGTFSPENMAYVNNPNGDLNDRTFNTAFDDIATTEATAKVVLLNLGRTVPTTPAAAGSVNVAGTPRGWKKVKVWQDAGGYKLQYADLASATPTTVSIAKDAAYNHVFFSLTANAKVVAQPETAKWDISFTTFTNQVFQDAVSAGSYFYSDYTVTNRLGGVTAVKITGDAAAYDAFSLTTLATGKYTFNADQRAIGADWRDVITRVVFNDVFFVLKDASGNYYKIKFISLLNANGERGYPVFQYALLK